MREQENIDLVKRLRLGDRMDGQKVDCKHDRCNCPIMDEAADAIEALQARVADARRDAFEEAAKVAEAHLLIDWLDPNGPEVRGANGMRKAIIAAIRALAEK